MKKILLTITLLLCSFLASAKETWRVKEMPEVTYLFMPFSGKIDANSKPVIDGMIALTEEAKKYELAFSKTPFMKQDFKNRTITEIGIEVTGPNIGKVPVNRIKTRQAGKFLIGHYVGKFPQDLFKSAIPQFKKNKLTLREEGGYTYAKNLGKEFSFILLFSVK